MILGSELQIDKVLYLYNAKSNIADAIQIGKDINSAVEEGLVSPEEGELLKRQIGTSTFNLITSKTLPKAKIEKLQKESNIKALEEARTYYLTEGNKEEDIPNTAG